MTKPTDHSPLNRLHEVLSNSLDNVTGPETREVEILQELLLALPLEQRVLAVATALTNGQKGAQDKAEREKIDERFAFIQNLDKALVGYSEYVVEVTGSSLPELVETAKELWSSDECVWRARWGGVTHVAEFFDSIGTRIKQHVGAVVALNNACVTYLNSLPSHRAAYEKGDYADVRDKYLQLLERESHGLLTVVDLGRDTAKSLLKLSAELQQSLKLERSSLLKLYGDDLETPQSGPLFKNNPFLTHFLNQIVQAIPDKREGSDELKYLAWEIEDFEKYLKIHGDGALLEAITSRGWFQKLGDVVEGLYSIHKAAYNAYVQVDLQEIRDTNPAQTVDRYSKLVTQATMKVNGTDEVQNPFDGLNFNATSTFFSTFSPALRPAEASTANDKQPSDRDRIYTNLYERLEGILEDLADGKDPFETDDIEEGPSEDEDTEVKPSATIAELMDLKEELRTPEKRKAEGQLQRDRKKGNYAFSADQENHGELVLKRVATHGVSFDDVKGESWTHVKGKLEGLLEYSELGYVHSHMSARGKSNNNMLIVGPYGCGKNMFLKALMSDPRTIGVNVTTDRILSMWYGQSEANVRRLFETSYEKRQEYDKPVVIGWDEFDSLYGSKQGQHTTMSHIDERLQKILQSVLDGDTVYDGVSLIGLTNEPKKIPVAIYRRFASVEIIKPLSAEERIGLVTYMMAGLPQAHNFEQGINWTAFAAQTEYASGDILGKVYDEIYARYLKACRAADKDILGRINGAARELVLSGEKLASPNRLAIFQEHAPGIVVSPDLFRGAVTEVLAKREIRSAIDQQRLFYRDVETLMEEAFKGSI